MFNMPNLSQLSQLKQLYDEFNGRHPKLISFFRMLSSQPLEAGTVIEVTVTRPGQEPIATNLKVQPEDVALLNQLKAMRGMQ